MSFVKSIIQVTLFGRVSSDALSVGAPYTPTKTTSLAVSVFEATQTRHDPRPATITHNTDHRHPTPDDTDNPKKTGEEAMQALARHEQRCRQNLNT